MAVCLGFIPGTIGEDGDPLDVLLRMDEPAFPGCAVSARIIGVLEAEQTDDGETVRNDRIIAVLRLLYPSASPTGAHAHLRRMNDNNAAKSASVGSRPSPCK